MRPMLGETVVNPRSLGFSSGGFRVYNYCYIHSRLYDVDWRIVSEVITFEFLPVSSPTPILEKVAAS